MLDAKEEEAMRLLIVLAAYRYRDGSMLSHEAARWILACMKLTEAAKTAVAKTWG